MSILAELIDFIRARKKYWLIPILILSVLLGGLLIVTKGSGRCAVHLHAVLRLVR